MVPMNFTNNGHTGAQANVWLTANGHFIVTQHKLAKSAIYTIAPVSDPSVIITSVTGRKDLDKVIARLETIPAA